MIIPITTHWCPSPPSYRRVLFSGRLGHPVGKLDLSGGSQPHLKHDPEIVGGEAGVGDDVLDPAVLEQHRGDLGSGLNGGGGPGVLADDEIN
jgi:hypothetical protein